MTNKKGESVKKKKRKEKEKKRKRLGRTREVFHGGRLGCSVNILVSLKEQACSVEKKVF